MSANPNPAKEADLKSRASDELERLRAKQLFRSIRICATDDGINLSSNDYLGLAHSSILLAKSQRAMAEDGVGAASSRLVSGTLPIHERLERALAEYLGCDSVLVFGAGYLANLGMCQALMSREDIVLADRFVHASLLDGIQLSRARLRRFHHNDLSHLEELLVRTSAARHRRSQVFVVTESVFSMDGDVAPLREIVELCERFGAHVIVDEAHALGVFGPQGRGRVLEAGLSERVTAISATLSKAFASYGGVVASSSLLRDFIINRARSFIYNTALPPAVAASGYAALELIRDQPQLGKDLLDRAETFREDLRRAGAAIGHSESQIIPIFIGAEEKALLVSAALRERGVLAVAIRPPTVPAGTARLRLSVTLGHTKGVLARAAEQIGAVLRENGVA